MSFCYFFYMSMSNHDLRGKRDILQSLDYLLYCYIAYLYFLDASFILLLFRLFLQVQLLSSGVFHKLLHVPLIITVVVYILSTCFHLFSTLGQTGIIIDFVGNHYLPNVTRLCLLDILIFTCQVIRLYVANDLASHTLYHGIGSLYVNDGHDQHQQNRFIVTSNIASPPPLRSSASSTETTISSNIGGYNRSNNSRQNSQDHREEIERHDDTIPTTQLDDTFYHDDIVMGISFSNLSQIINSRRRQYVQDDEDSTLVLPT
ncbi:uncharacterized protein BX664DRAFT_17302 [Halteromyces radiatus]|uniref:uncharacterized protein n=1 Tax=Halteromyces radiatus TaxID=101107 RepID=UPI00221FBDB9|nr:uncharacterized protein BX664DRAFT_17302 [Halteromyces radiatus]KAI8099252.1 hypothetical protein BX664DRAFT_17302 [Halteromyces radiatus]